LPIAVNHAFAGDRDIRCIDRAHKRLQVGQMKLGPGWVIRMIGGAKQRGPFVELKGDVALQDDRSAQIRSSNQPNSAAAFDCTCVDRRLNCGCVFGDAVSLGPIRAWIAAGR
jgi:hypothetical protein